MSRTMIKNKFSQLFVGMDLHKNSSTFCVKTKDGKIVASEKILTDKNHVTDFINNCREQTENVSLVMEPVSQWYYYADLIENLNVDVKLAHPMKTKAIASAKIKTDKIDARTLADLLRANLVPEAYFSPKEVRGWKEICRFRVSLVKLQTQVKNKIHAILFKHALKHNFSDLFGKGGKNWLSTLKLKEPFQTNLERYLVLLEQLEDMVKQAEKDIENTVKEHPQADLLVSIPGISYYSALTIVAEIGNIERFPSPKQLQSYAGLVPSTYNSGDKQVHGKITKQGSKWLRYIMIEAAHHQTRCTRIPGFGSYYNSIKKRKGSKTAAVATARKILAVVWRLLKDNRPYEPVDPRRRKSRTLPSKISP